MPKVRSQAQRSQTKRAAASALAQRAGNPTPSVRKAKNTSRTGGTFKHIRRES
jgi:hypothetical protein